jgi:hypothetical protein
MELVRRTGRCRAAGKVFGTDSSALDRVTSQPLEQLMRGTALETQPESFLKFARDAREWLKKHFVSLRGKNTADNFQEHLRVERLRT